MSTSGGDRVFNLIFALCALGLLCTLGCAPTYSQASDAPARPQESTTGQVKPPKAGLRVMVVEEGGQAQRAGVRPMDVIYQYGEFNVADRASFFAAGDAYVKRAGRQVELLVWRDGATVRLTVAPGQLGVETHEYNPVSLKFNDLMNELNVALQLPENMLREAKEKGVLKSPENILQEARLLLDAAEREETLTPAQVLVGRIYMTLDDATPEDLKRQAELLDQLSSTQPANYVLFLGHKVFFKDKRYRAAVACFKHHLKAEPSDESTWLNMGIAYSELGMLGEVESAADYVLDNKLPLSRYGCAIAYQLKALAALGRGDYPKSMTYAEKSFELHPNGYRMNLWQLAAAQNGDLRQFYEVSRKCMEALPQEYERVRHYVDAAEAHVLMKNGQQERARQTVMKWKDTPGAASKVRSWKGFPGGSEVIKTWEKFLGGADPAAAETGTRGGAFAPGR